MSVVFRFAPGAAPADIVAREIEGDPVEMANLPETRTGVPGVISVCTRQGRDGPRVQWHPRCGVADEPFLTVTLEDPPRILNHGVASRDASGAVAAAEWAAPNRDALPHFRNEGTSWMYGEVSAFIDGLRKLP